MMRVTVFALVCSVLPFLPVRATEYIPTSATINLTAPTSAQITNWSTGWTQPAGDAPGTITGWNYCGSVGGNSAVYLGNGWVLTAAHVGTGDFVLADVHYPMVTGSAQTNFGGADLILFKVSPAPALPPLPIRSTDPVLNSSQIVMIGFGDVGPGENNMDDTYRAINWGTDKINFINKSTTVAAGNGTYTSNDFYTANGGGNNYELIIGDSGGPDFIYNSTSGIWELAGLNEAQLVNGQGVQDGSAFVQLNTYLPQINTAMAPPSDTPAMPASAMGVMAASLVAMAAASLARRDHLPSKASSKG